MRRARLFSVAVVAGLQFCALTLTMAEDLLPSKLLYNLNFDDGTLTGWKKVSVNPMPVITTEATRVGKYATRSFLDSSDPDPEKRERVEMIADRSANAAVVGQEFWYGWSVYLANPYPVDKTHGEILTQFHCYNDSPEEHGRNPTLAFHIYPGSTRWTIVNRSDSRLISYDKTGIVTKNYDVGPFITNEWTDWVVNVKWSYGTDGFLKIWKNGQLVVDAKGPNTYNDALGPHFKMGIYKPAWNVKAPDPLVKTRLAYHDEFKMAGSNGSYNSVAPGIRSIQPSPPTEVRVQ